MRWILFITILTCSIAFGSVSAKSSTSGFAIGADSARRVTLVDTLKMDFIKCVTVTRHLRAVIDSLARAREVKSDGCDWIWWMFVLPLIILIATIIRR